MRIGSSGNVGIGTLPTVERLSVASTSVYHFSFKNNLSSSLGALGYDSDDNMRVFANGAERMRITSLGNVGVGTTAPVDKMEVVSPVSVAYASGSAFIAPEGTKLRIANTASLDNSYSGITFSSVTSGNVTSISYIGSLATSGSTSGSIVFGQRTTSTYTERMRIDSSGNVLVGKTADNITVAGLELRGSGEILFTRNGDMATFNRLTTDGDAVRFRKNNTPVGSIGTQTGALTLDGAANYTGVYFGTTSWLPRYNGVNTDDLVDVGSSVLRMDDIYATNGTIQTSDRNEKQDIEELSEAEHRVAVACKGLLRKFRWISSVEEKGDDARIHFGIIAQDLQAAFEAEGLDAGRYAMFINTDWWEHEVEMPAVEAQEEVYETVVTPAEYDEEGNEVSPETTEQRLVSEAVEGKEAYTRTDTYNSEEEAPEGSVKKSRMGVRYSELLAFIIAGL
jgi:hypothetical protein